MTNEPEKPAESSGELVNPLPLPPEVQRLDPKTRQAVEQYVAVSVRFHAGPFPPADQLKEYEDASPGAAAIIIGMAQAEQKHRHYCQKAEVDGLGRGQRFDLLAFAMAMVVAIYFAYTGAPGAAAGMAGTAITVFGGAFILARHLSSKKQNAPPPAKPPQKDGQKAKKPRR